MSRKPNVAAAMENPVPPPARSIVLDYAEDWYSITSALARRRLLDGDNLDEIAGDLDIAMSTAEELLAPVAAHYRARRTELPISRKVDPAKLLPLISESSAQARAEAIGQAVYNLSRANEASKDFVARVVTAYAAAVNTDRQILLPGSLAKESPKYVHSVSCRVKWWLSLALRETWPIALMAVPRADADTSALLESRQKLFISG